jgi:hypothetical protein
MGRNLGITAKREREREREERKGNNLLNIIYIFF